MKTTKLIILKNFHMYGIYFSSVYCIAKYACNIYVKSFEMDYGVEEDLEENFCCESFEILHMWM